MDKYSMDAWSSLKENDPVMMFKGTVAYLFESIADLQDLVTVLTLTVRSMQVKAGAVDLTDELEDYLKLQAKENSNEQEKPEEKN